MVDPDARTLEAYQLQEGGQWLLLGTLMENDQVQQPPFDAVSFPPGDLWALTRGIDIAWHHPRKRTRWPQKFRAQAVDAFNLYYSCLKGTTHL